MLRSPFYARFRWMLLLVVQATAGRCAADDSTVTVVTAGSGKQAGATVQFLDAASLKPQERLDLAFKPSRIVPSPDGRWLCVFGPTTAGKKPPDRIARTPASASLVNLSSRQVKAVPLPDLPTDFEFSPDSASVVFLSPGGKGRPAFLTFVDLASGDVSGSLEVPAGVPFGKSVPIWGVTVFWMPDGRTLLVRYSTLWFQKPKKNQPRPPDALLVDAGSMRVVNEFRFPRRMWRLAVTPRDSLAYLFVDQKPADRKGPGIENRAFVIDLGTRGIVDSISVGFDPITVLNDPDNGGLFSCSRDAEKAEQGTLAFLSGGAPATGTGWATYQVFTVEPGDVWLTARRDGKFLYALNTQTNDLTLIDTGLCRPVERMNTGPGSLMTVAVPGGDLLLVLRPADITVVDTRTNRICARHHLPVRTSGLARPGYAMPEFDVERGRVLIAHSRGITVLRLSDGSLETEVEGLSGLLTLLPPTGQAPASP